MIRGIDHVVIAVRDIEAGIRTWRDTLGLKLTHRASSKEAGLEIAFFSLDDGTFLELVAPTLEGGALQEFLAANGEGVRLLSVRVDDLNAMVARLGAQGVPMDGAGTARVFVKPDAATGVLLQLWPSDRPHRWRDGEPVPRSEPENGL